MTRTSSGLLYLHREAQVCPPSLSSSLGALCRARPSHQGSQHSPVTGPKRARLRRERQGTGPGQALYELIKRMGGGGFRPRPPGVLSSRTAVLASEIWFSPATASGVGPVIGGRTGPRSVTDSCSTSCEGSDHEMTGTCCDQTANTSGSCGCLESSFQQQHRAQGPTHRSSPAVHLLQYCSTKSQPHHR